MAYMVLTCCVVYLCVVVHTWQRNLLHLAREIKYFLGRPELFDEFGNAYINLAELESPDD